MSLITPKEAIADILRLWEVSRLEREEKDQQVARLERENDALKAELKTYSPIGTVAGGATERTFMHPSVKFILPTGLQLYARIEVREEDKV
jgi:hypothetical protein